MQGRTILRPELQTNLRAYPKTAREQMSLIEKCVQLGPNPAFSSDQSEQGLFSKRDRAFFIFKLNAMEWLRRRTNLVAL